MASQFGGVIRRYLPRSEIAKVEAGLCITEVEGDVVEGFESSPMVPVASSSMEEHPKPSMNTLRTGRAKEIRKLLQKNK